MSEKTESNFINRLGCAPIVVGVTGHRDIPDADNAVLETATRSVLTKIAGLTPNSPRVLISCLAEGADRIAAYCALEMGWMLGVILPSPVEVYERDFEGFGSKEEFHELLCKATWVEVVPSLANSVSDYFGAGVRLMQQSQQLIAYWDGKSTGLAGGTSDVVERFTSEIPHAGRGMSSNTIPDARPVIHIVTRRHGDLGFISQEKVGRITFIAPHPQGMSGEGELERWSEVVERIDVFNKDAMVLIKSDPSALACSKSYLKGGGAAATSVRLLLAEPSKSMFAIADALSQQAQKTRGQIFFVIGALAALAIVLQQLFSGPFPSPQLLWGAVVAIVLAALAYKWEKKERLESRYLDYRSLAEACRVQYYWKLAGIDASVADYFLSDQRDELEWIRQALRTNELSVDVGELEKETDLSSLESIRLNWIEDQRHYFMGTKGKGGGNNAKKNNDQSKVWSSWAAVFFWLGVGLLIVFTISQPLLTNSSPESAHSLSEWFDVAYGLLFSAAGIIKVYQEVKAFSEHSNSYRKSGLLMQRASQRLEGAIKANSPDAAVSIIVEIGLEALDENGDWLVLHRDRPVEVPLG